MQTSVDVSKASSIRFLKSIIDIYNKEGHRRSTEGDVVRDDGSSHGRSLNNWSKSTFISILLNVRRSCKLSKGVGANYLSNTINKQPILPTLRGGGGGGGDSADSAADDGSLSLPLSENYLILLQSTYLQLPPNLKRDVYLVLQTLLPSLPPSTHASHIINSICSNLENPRHGLEWVEGVKSTLTTGSLGALEDDIVELSKTTKPVGEEESALSLHPLGRVPTSTSECLWSYTFVDFATKGREEEVWKKGIVKVRKQALERTGILGCDDREVGGVPRPTAPVNNWTKPKRHEAQSHIRSHPGRTRTLQMTQEHITNTCSIFKGTTEANKSQNCNTKSSTNPKGTPRALGALISK